MKEPTKSNNKKLISLLTLERPQEREENRIRMRKLLVAMVAEEYPTIRMNV